MVKNILYKSCFYLLFCVSCSNNKVTYNYSMIENASQEREIHVDIKNNTETNIFLIYPLTEISKYGFPRSEYLIFACNDSWSKNEGIPKINFDTVLLFQNSNIDEYKLRYSSFYKKLDEKTKTIKVPPDPYGAVVSSDTVGTNNLILPINKNGHFTLKYKIDESIKKGKYKLFTNETANLEFSDIYTNAGKVDGFQFYNEKIKDTPFEFEIK